MTMQASPQWRGMTAPATAVLLGGILLALLLGCVRETREVDSAFDPGTRIVDDQDAEPELLMSSLSRQILRGDTLVLHNGQEVRLAGLEAPNPGAPQAEVARDTLSRLVTHQTLRLLYTTETDAEDDVWFAHVLIPNPQGLEIPLEDGTMLNVPPGEVPFSVNGYLLRAGLARAQVAEDLAFMTWTSNGSEQFALTDGQNKAVRDYFRNQESLARQERLGIWSSASG